MKVHRRSRGVGASRCGVRVLRVHLPVATRRLAAARRTPELDGAVRDLRHQIADLRHEQRKLEVALAQYLNLYDFAPVGYLTLWADGRVQEANRAAARLLGKPPAALIGKPLAQFVAPADRAVLDEYLAQCAADPRPTVAEMCMQVGPQRALAVQMHTLAMRSPGVEDLLLRMALLDVSERKQVETALLQSRDDLEQRVAQRTAELAAVNEDLRREMAERRQAEDCLRRNERLASIGTLAAGIAHEINNPIGAAQLAAEAAMMLLDRPEKRPQLEQSLHAVVKSVERAGNVIRRLLQFSRATGGQQRPIAIADVIEHTRAWTTSLAAEKNVRLVVEIPAPLPEMLLNPMEMEQALINLVHNAVWAAPPGSAVTLRAESAGGEVRVAVVDTGRGMCKAELSRLFDPFYTTRQAENATGLGLSTALGIVRQHGGTIDVQSSPGRGTTMTIVLPLPPAGTDAPPPPA